MANVSLDSIKEAAEKKYGALTIEGIPGGDVKLENVLRLSDEKFAEVSELQDKLDDAKPSEALDIAKQVLAAVLSPEAYKRLMTVVGDDRTMLMEILTQYGEQTQVGEAEPSAS